MAISGVKNLPIETLLGLCQNIYSQFECDASLKNIVGLFRVGGAKVDTDKILSSGQIPRMTKFNVHTVLDVIKRILPELKNRIAEVATDNIAVFQSVSCTLSSDDNQSIVETAKALNMFISSMVASGDIKQENLAEMLYGYIHLGAMFSGASDINKMTMENCAIVIGPNIDDMLGLVDLSGLNMFAAATKMDLVKHVICMAIESKEYDMPFIEKYAQTLLESRLERYSEIRLQIEGVNKIIKIFKGQKVELDIKIEKTILNIKSLESTEKKPQDKRLKKGLIKGIQNLINENKIQLEQLYKKVSAVESYLDTCYTKKQECMFVKSKLEPVIQDYKFITFLNGNFGSSIIQEPLDLAKPGDESNAMLHLRTAMSEVDIFDREQSVKSVRFAKGNKIGSKTC